MTRGDLSLLRLVAHGVVGPHRSDPAGAVARMLCLQAQEDWSGLTSVAVRSTGRTSDAVAALDAGAVVRSWPMRGTLHLLATADLRWMLDLLGPRQLQGRAARRIELGVDTALLDRAYAVAEKVSGGTGVSRVGLIAAWGEAGIDTSDGRDYFLVTTLAQMGALCYGPVRNGRPQLVAVDRWVPAAAARDRTEALAELGLRYLTSHGPATPADLARWAGLTAGDTKLAVAAARPYLESLEVEGTEYLMAPGVQDALQDCRRQAEEVLVLPGFDEMVFGYRDRSPTVPAELAPKVVTTNAIGRNTVLLRGQVVATWARGARSKPPVVTPLVDLSPEIVALAATQAAALAGG